METFELVPKLLSVGPAYEVRGDGGKKLYTVKGSALWAKPKVDMLDARGERVAKMRGNVLRTKLAVVDAKGAVLAKIAFPLLGLRKSFRLELGAARFSARATLLGGDFSCKGEGGEVVLAVAKKASLRDVVSVRAGGAVPPEVAILAAVAIDQRFFSAA